TPGAADAAAAATGSRRTRRNVRVWQAAAALLALIAVASTLAWWAASRPTTPSVTRFFVYPPEKSTFLTNARSGASVAISPDGNKIAFTARDMSGKVLLWIRAIDSLTAQPLPATDDATYPFWSPDTRCVASFAQR